MESKKPSLLKAILVVGGLMAAIGLFMYLVFFISESQQQEKFDKIRQAKARDAANKPATILPSPFQPEPGNSFGNGRFEVGKDVQPGKYRTPGPEAGMPLCYFERLKGFSGEIEDIIANEAVQGPSIAIIKSTDQGFGSTGCQRWTKAE